MNYAVVSNQSILDIACEIAGTVDAAFDFIKSNPGLDLETPLKSGDILIIPQYFENREKETADYFVKTKQKIATGITATQFNNWILATNFWNDNGIWIDTEFWQD